MKAAVSSSSKSIIFRFFPNRDDEKLFSKTIHLSSRSCYFEMPTSIQLDNIHPDLLALSALLLSYPFIYNELELDFSVSGVFQEICLRDLDITLKTPKAKISPRIIENGVPALAFSGGVDSNAAFSLLPDDKVVYFIDRIQPYSQKTIYNKFAAKAAFEDVKKINPKSYSISTDMEYLRSKVGFPLDPTNPDVPLPVAIPALLMADTFNIDAVAFGIIMESVYMVGHEVYEDYLQSAHYNKWAPVFNHVNCNLFLPTGGITEVGTTLISDKSKTSSFIRSCMRGDESQPCGKCIKCFRKTLLRKAATRTAANSKNIIINLDSAEVATNLYGEIYQHENIYRYICNFLPSNNVVNLLKQRVQIESENCSWMEKWFPESIELVPGKYRLNFLSKLFAFIDPMNPTEISYVKSWNANILRNVDPLPLKKWQDFLYTNASPKVKLHIDKNLRRVQ
jgi:hypothetical protein